jgi:uncharacterized membrane protein YedE/YeeE
MEHWSFWAGGLALGVVAVLYTAVVRRPFGVSGAIGGLVVAGDDDDDDEKTEPGLSRRLSLIEQAAFVGAIAGGAALSSLLAGSTAAATTTATNIDSFSPSWGAIAIGAVLVGFGTQWARGCTSGHGLVGVARLQRPSLVATGVFFGTAIVVSFVVDAFGGI